MGGQRPPHVGTPDAEGGGACQYENKGTRRTSLKYVEACASQRWSIVSWKKDDPEQRSKRSFRCKSWRHEGDCAKWKAAQDFVRIRDGLKERKNLVYMVLTIDPKRWKNTWSAYRGGFHCWKRLVLRLERRYGGKVEYVSTIEAHKSGYPHYNFVIENKGIYDAVEKHIRLVERQLKRDALGCGFSWKSYVEPLQDFEAMSGYLVKLSNELVKSSQIPVNAPKHFRRIRSSRGFLPAVHKHDGTWTGKVVFHPVDEIVVGGCEHESKDGPSCRGRVAVQRDTGNDPEGGGDAGIDREGGTLLNRDKEIPVLLQRRRDVLDSEGCDREVTFGKEKKNLRFADLLCIIPLLVGWYVCMYDCVKCGGKYSERQSYCYMCGGFGTIIQLADRPVSSLWNDTAEGASAAELLKKRGSSFTSRAYPSIKVGSKGLVSIYGPPGGGKTTMMMKFLDGMDGNVLMVSVEEGLSSDSMLDRLRWLEISRDDFFIGYARTAEDFDELMQRYSPTIVGVDSLSASTFLIDDLKRASVTFGIPILFNLHVTKAGDPAGDMRILHECDIVIRVNDLKWKIEKSRFSGFCEGAVV